MRTFQVIYVAVMMISLGMHLAKHGEPYDRNYNFWIALGTRIIELTLLYFGGFFK